MVGTAFGLATAQDSVDDWIASARPVVDVPQRLSEGVLVICAVLLVATSFVVLGNAIVRTWRARGPERAQLLLLVLTGAVTLACAFSPWNELFSVSLILVPIAVAIGVLRYNLLGIEVVVRRTLLYGLLTAIVAAVYAGVVALVSLATPNDFAPAVLAAAVVAVGLLPVRQRLQTLVDIVVYGERRDPVAAVTRLGAELPDDDPLPAVVKAVGRSLRSPYVAITAVNGQTRAATAEAEPDDSLHVPLRRGAHDLGSLIVAPAAGGRFDASDRLLLEALCVQVAAVVLAVDLSDDLEAARARTVAAALAERRRLRHDLHDGLGPSLTGIGLGLEAVDAAVADDPARARVVVRRLRAEVVTAVEDVRRILDGLRPPALDEVGLVTALQDRAALLSDRCAGSLTVRVEAPDPLPALDPETEMAAFRIAEEALTNIVRHSGAACAVVRLVVDDGRLTVEVTDDGRGLPSLPRQGVGLESMQRRAESLGGTLDVTSDAGVRVLALLPVGVA
jgi:signal transduction histidine kinase